MIKGLLLATVSVGLLCSAQLNAQDSAEKVQMVLDNVQQLSEQFDELSENVNDWSKQVQSITANITKEPQGTSETVASPVDLAAGETLYKANCKNCHGPTAKGMASFPKLAGKDTDYLASRLMQYRSGEKVGANTPLMMPQAAKLTDEDIANVVQYIVKNFE